MNAVQEAAMKVEPIPEPMQLKPEAVQLAALEAQKENAKKMLRIITDGLGAIRRGTFEGHDMLSLAELEIFLKNVSNDLRTSIGAPSQPAAEFHGPHGPAPDGGKA